jgi:hypothetical protein
VPFFPFLDQFSLVLGNPLKGFFQQGFGRLADYRESFERDNDIDVRASEMDMHGGVVIFPDFEPVFLAETMLCCHEGIVWKLFPDVKREGAKFMTSALIEARAIAACSDVRARESALSAVSPAFAALVAELLAVMLADKIVQLPAVDRRRVAMGEVPDVVRARVEALVRMWFGAQAELKARAGRVALVDVVDLGDADVNTNLMEMS